MEFIHHLVNAGATWLDQPVVRNGNWLTSRGPQDMVPFVRELVPFFAGQAPTAQTLAVESTDSAASSSPQRDAPAQLVLQVMKWLPRPSLRTLVLVGAFAVFYAARNSHHGLRRGPVRRHAGQATASVLAPRVAEYQPPRHGGNHCFLSMAMAEGTRKWPRLAVCTRRIGRSFNRSVSA
ncbi:MAG: DJ-1/PfpI family protein [Comamonas sp.]